MLFIGIMGGIKHIVNGFSLHTAQRTNAWNPHMSRERSLGAAFVSRSPRRVDAASRIGQDHRCDGCGPCLRQAGGAPSAAGDA